MKNIIKIITLLITLLFILSCKKEDNPIQDITVKSKLKSDQIVSASNTFGFNLLKEIEKIVPDSNIFISPFSALEALSMTYNGANNITKTEMANVLGYANYSDEEVNNYNQSLTEALLTADEKVEFEIANSIWCLQGFSFLQTFLDVNRIYYDAEITSLDFFKPEALQTINNWANNKTHEKIPEILDYIDPNAVMYLINAIYFKGTWKYQFDKSKTTNADFFEEDGTTVQHRQMEMEAEINYYNDDEFQVIELPYGNGTFNLMALLPKTGNTVSKIISGFNDELLKKITDSMEKTKVVVKLPKFKFEMNSLLNDPLKSMGMESAFAFNADFSRMDGYTDLCISRVIHKTYIDLDEEGTEAAAVTAVEIVEKVSDPNFQNLFIANKPFVYAITEKSTGAVLFIGTMMDPTIGSVELK